MDPLVQHGETTNPCSLAKRRNGTPGGPCLGSSLRGTRTLWSGHLKTRAGEASTDLDLVRNIGYPLKVPMILGFRAYFHGGWVEVGRMTLHDLLRYGFSKRCRKRVHGWCRWWFPLNFGASSFSRTAMESTRWCPPSYKLVYNPNNYRYNPHKP